MKTTLRTFFIPGHPYVYVNENPAPSPSVGPSKSVGSKQEASKKAGAERDQLKAEIKETPEQLERRKLEQELHGIGGGVVKDVRLWKDEKYDVNEVRAQIPKLKILIEKLSHIHPDNVPFMKMLTIYLNPGSIKQSILIKEGFHADFKGVAVDYTEDMNEMTKDIAAGFVEFLKDISTVEYDSGESAFFEAKMLAPGTEYLVLAPHLKTKKGEYFAVLNNLGGRNDCQIRRQAEPYIATIVDIMDTNKNVIATFSTDKNGKLVLLSKASGVEVKFGIKEPSRGNNHYPFIEISQGK